MPVAKMMAANRVCHLFFLFMQISCIATENNVSNDILLIEDDIVKSPIDRRQYRALTLTNGMKILLISDKEAPASNVVLDVNVGYMNSPKDIPYLADLFANTFLMAALPQVQKIFYAQEGAHIPCTTTADHSVFTFIPIYAPLADALKRLSDLLVSPQISMELLEKGMWAYDMEARNLQFKPDYFKFQTLRRTMADHNHDYYAPNLLTEEYIKLKNESTNKFALLKNILQFYDQHYSPNLMSLAIVAKQNISEMTQFVVPLFSRVSNKNLPVPVWPNHPYGLEQTGYLFHIKAGDIYKHRLILLFNIPDYASIYFESKPWSYVIFALTRKGERSLPIVLKEKGWAEKVEANVEKEAAGFGFFKIDCRLTQKGEQSIDQVVRMIMEYVNYLKSVGPQEWIHAELRKELEIDFENLDARSIAIEDLASKLHWVPAKYCVNERYIMKEYRPQLIMKVLSYLTVDNMNLYVWSDSFTGKPGKVETIFHKNYTMEKLTRSFLGKLSTKSESVHFTLPTPNPYLQSKLQEYRKHVTSFSNISLPKIIRQSESHRIWHLKDDFFMSPQVFIGFKLTNPTKHRTLSNYVASVIYLALTRRVLRTRFEQEEKARLNVDFMSRHNDYVLWFSGRGEKIMHNFVIRVFETLVESTAVTEERFRKYMAKYVKYLNRRNKESPMGKSRMYIEFLLSPLKWTSEEIDRSTKTLAYDQFKKFQQEFFSKLLFIEMFSYGNITKQDSIKVYDAALNAIRKRFAPKSLSLVGMEKPKTAILPEGKQYIIRTTSAKSWFAPFVRSLYQFNPIESPEKKAISRIVSCVIRKIRKEHLRERSKNSKGSYYTKQENRFTIFFSTRGNCIETTARDFSSTPEQINLASENYLKFIEKTLTEMDETKFQKFERCTKQKRFDMNIDKAVLHSMGDVANLYWSPILSGEYTFSFNKTQKLNDLKKNVSRDDILSFYKEILSAHSPKRRKFSVYVYKSNESKANGHKNLIERSSNATYITDIKAFKRSLQSYAAEDGMFEPIIPMLIERRTKLTHDNDV